MLKIQKEQEADMLECLLDMGELLLESGAEISRVEDTLCRIARAYGAVRADAFVITSIVSITIEFTESDLVTENRRIYSSSGTDFYRLEKLNELSRRICHSPEPLSEFRKAISEVTSREKPFSIILLGSILAAGGFAVFFGGSVNDGITASFFAWGICLLQKYLGRTQINPAASNLLISLATGLCVGMLCRVITTLHMDKILIGDIMLLIPGLAMTNAVRNILVGNTISGVVRLTECFLWALSLAGGFMTAIMILEIL